MVWSSTDECSSSLKNVRGRRGSRRRRASSAAIQDDRPDLIEQTLGVWQPLASRKLTREDGREIIENMTGFFKLLLEWDAKERRAARPRRPVIGRDRDFDCAPNRSPAD